MEGKKLIVERRSVREFDNYYVTDEDLHELLDAARFAPSWANSQSSYFIALRDKKVIKKLVETCYPNNRANKCSLDASLILVACYEKKKSGYYKGMSFDKVGTWGMFDLGLACQNISLRAYEMGLGTVIVGAYDFDNAKEILGVEEPYEIGAIIPVGRRTAEPKVPPRRDIKEMYRTI